MKDFIIGRAAADGNQIRVEAQSGPTQAIVIAGLMKMLNGNETDLQIWESIAKISANVVRKIEQIHDRPDNYETK